jgi:type IV pilus assembly protein PilA
MGGITKMKALKKGFTLIELIVVIAILAILALLIVPQVTGYIAQANMNVAKANADSCYTEWIASDTATAAGFSSPIPSVRSDCKVTLTNKSGTITWTGNGYTGTVTVTDGNKTKVEAAKN